MAVKYSGLLKFTDEIKAEIDLAADGTVEKAVLIDGDGTETPIGGSTSDYTTATVTLTNSLASTVQFAVASIVSSHHGDSIFPVTAVEESTTETVTVLMYKGAAICQLLTPSGQGVEATTSGSITSTSPNTFRISGNGAITISAS